MRSRPDGRLGVICGLCGFLATPGAAPGYEDSSVHRGHAGERRGRQSEHPGFLPSRSPAGRALPVRAERYPARNCRNASMPHPRMALPRRAAHTLGSPTGRRSSPGGRRSWGRGRGRPVCRSSCVRTWGTPFSCLQPSTMSRDPLHITHTGRHGAYGHPARLDPHWNSRPAQAGAAFCAPGYGPVLV